jgi:hypothetical protein
MTDKVDIDPALLRAIYDWLSLGQHRLLQALMQALQTGTVPALLHDNPEKGSIMADIGELSRSEPDEGEPVDELKIVPGGSARLPEPNILPQKYQQKTPYRYMHWCLRCNQIFFSEDAEPGKCAKCKHKYWRGDFVRDVRRPWKSRAKAAAPAEAYEAGD